MLSWTMDEFTSLNRVISVCDLIKQSCIWTMDEQWFKQLSNWIDTCGRNDVIK